MAWRKATPVLSSCFGEIVGALLTRPKTGGVVIVANGRADWVGSLELREEPVDEEAMRNTARVMNDITADVLGIVEVESRPVIVLLQFIDHAGGRRQSFHACHGDRRQ